MRAIPHNGFLLRLCTVLLAMLGLVACNGGGGGGGDGGGGGGSSSITYTGLTSQASITSANAALLAGGAFLAGSTAASASLAGAQTASATGSIRPRSLLVAMALRKSVTHLDLSPNVAITAGTQITEPGIPGPCGGSISYTFNVDDATGDFSGTLNFNNYCEEGVTESGSIIFSGRIDLVTLDFIWMRMETSAMNISTSNESFGMAGVIEFTDITFNSERIRETLRFRGPDGMVVQNEAFIFDVFYNTNTIRVVSGRFYRPTEGYVDVAGDVDFQFFNLLDDYPYAGRLVVTGAGGSRARLTANGDAQTFMLEVDPDGDGIYDPPIHGNQWNDL